MGGEISVPLSEQVLAVPGRQLLKLLCPMNPASLLGSETPTQALTLRGLAKSPVATHPASSSACGLSKSATRVAVVLYSAGRASWVVVVEGVGCVAITHVVDVTVSIT